MANKNKQQQKDDDKNSWLDDIASKDIRVEQGQVKLVAETVPDLKKHRIRRDFGLTALVVLFILTVGWLVAGIFFQKIQLGDSQVSAQISNDTLYKLIQNQVDTYKLNIIYPDGSQKDFSLQDVGFQVDTAKTVDEVRHQQDQFSNHIQWWRPVRVNLALANNSKINAFIANQATITTQPAKDAKLTISNGQVKIADSEAGKHYGIENPTGTLISMVSQLKTQPLKLVTLSTNPAISSKQLGPYQERLKEILGQNVEFTIEGNVIKATSADIGSWLELTPVGHAIDINVNSGKVLAYINSISANYIYPTKAQVEVKHDDGSTAILVKGVSGTDVTNKSTVATDVSKDLLKNQAIQSDLVIKYATYQTVTAQDYPKWIEVNITTKQMYLYEKDKLVHTYLISAGAPATPTVTGQFTIYSKLVQQDMRGFNVDGSKYFQPNVAWVNYFYEGYAIHGNYWRPLSWFGNINSSHGCVSLPDNLARTVYDWAPIGTHVIVHY